MNEPSTSGGWKKAVKSAPVIGPIAKYLYLWLIKPPKFRSSSQYWEARYSKGGTSGAGSYRRLAEFKAQVLNQFVEAQDIRSVVELGSGDGAQLTLARYPAYTGIDVSQRAVNLCSEKFRLDPSKKFIHTSKLDGLKVQADLALSLDVIYSSNFDGLGPDAHVRHRCFSDWISRNAPEWTLVKSVPNAYPYDAAQPNDTSWADFYFFRKTIS